MIPFLDLHNINQRFNSEFKDAFNTCLEASHFILGQNVLNFETQFASYCGTQYCIGTANGLDALTLILKGYITLGKLKEGDKVIVPANTFIATILSVLHANLVPVFTEPNPETYNLDVAGVKANLTPEVKAIIMVHLYGQLADVEAIHTLATNSNLILIEDAAQAHGAEYSSNANPENSNSLKAGNLSHAAAFSFYPSKNLGALGDGGAITTNDSELFETIKLLRNYGSSKKYTNEIIGYNSRLDDMQAAFLSIKLNKLDEDNSQRRRIANRYLKAINNPKLKLPFYDGSKNHVFYAFVIEVEHRTHFIEYLNQHEIGWLIHYPTAPHHQKALASYAHLKLPITELIHNTIISLPISPVMTNTQIESVISVLNAYT